MATVLSRRLVPTPSLRTTPPALLPFLYQTRTIQWTHATDRELNLNPSEEQVNDELQSIKSKWSTNKYGAPTRRKMERRPRTPQARQNKIEAVPFEGSTGSANPEERFAGTTMTARELQIFEELFRKGVKATPEENKKQFVSRAARDFPELLQPLAEEAKELREQAALKTAAGERAGKGKPQSEDLEIRDKQSKKIEKLMDNANTDIELWHVLEQHVLSRIRGMGIDHDIKPARYAALPGLLSHYVSLIQSHFPGSPLGLVLLSELRKLGPSAFALSASTGLYNRHMRMLWKHYTDVDAIIEILAEMDKEVYAFDEETQLLVAEIWDYSRDARNGVLGPGLRALWGTDRKERALDKLRLWSQTVNKRLEAAALRRVQQESASFEDDERDIVDEERKDSVAA